MKEELLEIIENEKELNITYHGIKKLLNSSKKKIKEENNKILRQHPTKPIYIANLVKYANYICHQPQKQIKVVIGENNVKD